MWRFIKITLFILFFVQNSNVLASGKNHIDSLKRQVSKVDDQTKMEYYFQLFYYESNRNLFQAEAYAKKLIDLSETQKDLSRKSDAFNLFGIHAIRAGTYYNASSFFDSSLVIARQIKDTVKILRAFNNLAYCYENLGLYDKANQFHFISKSYFRFVDKVKTIGYIHYNEGYLYSISNQFNEALTNYNKALEVFIQYDDSYGIQITVNSIGRLYFANGQTEKALQSFLSILDYGKGLDDKYNTSMTYQNMAEVYLKIGALTTAYRYLQIAFDLKKDCGVFESRIYNQFGDYYLAVGNLTKAYNYFQIALTRSKTKGEAVEIENSYKNITEYYSKIGDHRRAYNSLVAYKSQKDSLRNMLYAKHLQEIQNKYKMLELDEELNALQTQTSQQDMVLQNELDKYQKQKIQILVILGFLVLIVLSFGILYYLNYSNKKKSGILEKQTKEYEQQQVAIEDQAKKLENINSQLEKISLIARETNNMIVIAESNGKIEWVNNAFEKQTGYTLDEFKRKYGSRLLNVSTNPEIESIIEEAIRNKKSVIYSSKFITKRGKTLWLQTSLTPFVGENGEVLKLIAVDTDISDIKNAEREIKKQKEEIEEHKNAIEKQRDQIQQQSELITEQMEKILESIFYAKKIQNAFLPQTKLMKKMLKEFFILNIQRDIVSGDFYWINQRLGKTIVSVADSTGHGVPGAFMSILGITFLNNIVNKVGLISPDKILNKLRDSVISSLHQTGKSGETSDGMDMFIGVLDYSKMKLEYAAANNSAYLLRNDELIELKLDQMPIGIHINDNQPFSLNAIDVKCGDVIYMFSDGFADQFGGHLGKKFKYKRFKQLLMNIYKHPMDYQKELLSESFYEWKGTIEQVDDILILGFKV